MSSQVEVQTGEVGRAVVGGRLHLGLLTDSSNKSLIEVNQSHIITEEPNKPVLGPKPLLSPRPFSVDKNPAIRPILAPKPQTKPRPESTRLAGYKPELSYNSKPLLPAATVKHRIASTNRPAPTSFKTSNKLNTGQTNKPVVQPFKPAPPFDPGDPSKPTAPVPAQRQKPGLSALGYSRSLKKPLAAEWSGTTKKEDEKDDNTFNKGGSSITRAKSMGFLAQAGQEEEEEEEKEKFVLREAVPLRPKPRSSRPRPVSAIFLDGSTKTEASVPSPRWAERRPLSADLTSKFESIGLSLHRTQANTKENTPEETALPQMREQEKTPKSTTPQSADVVAKPALSDQSSNKLEETTVNEFDENKRRVSIKSRISLLLDSSSLPGTGATGQGSDLDSPGKLIAENEPPVGVKQLIKQLTVDTPPGQIPVPKPTVKPRPLPLDLTKRFSSERSPDLGSALLSEATGHHEIGKDLQRRYEEMSPKPGDRRTFMDLNPEEQLQKASTPEGPKAGLISGATSKESGLNSEVHTVRASLFDNVVERHSVLMMDEEKSVNKPKDSLRSPSFKRGGSEDEGTLVTATYKEPVSPSSSLRVIHAFDKVQAIEETRAVSENVPSAQWEDKAMTLRSRRSEGSRPVAERTGSAQPQPTLPVNLEQQQPRYLRVGALPKWTDAGMEKGMLKESQREGEKDKERHREAEQDEASAAPKRLKTLQTEEQQRPRSTYFALTGQIQEQFSPVDAGANTGDVAVPFDNVRSALGGSQGKVLPFRRNPSLDDAFEKSSPEQVEELMRSRREVRTDNRDAQATDEVLDFGRKRELKEETEKHKAKMKELEREKQRQLEMEKQAHLEFSRMKERERQREFERQRQKAFEKEKQEFEKKQRALEQLEQQRQMDLEIQRQQEMERQRQIEHEKQRLQEIERRNQIERENQRQQEMERQRQIEHEKQRLQEMERRKQIERENQRQQEMERQRQIEHEKQKLQEMERQKQRELERERQRQLEREMERERLREQERERQREQERLRQREEERQRELDKERQLLEIQREKQRLEELERQQLLEFQKQKQKERERQQLVELEKQRLREKSEREEAEKTRQMALEQEMLRLKELEKERERQRERQWEMERQKEMEKEQQRQLERQRQLDVEREELEKQRLRQRELEKERLRKEEMERLLEMENRRLQEYEKQKQAERDKQILELEKRRLRDKMEKEEAEKMRLVAKHQEAERQRLKEKQKKEEQERARLESSSLRPQVLDLDSVLRNEPSPKAAAQRSDPATRWKEPSLRVEQSYKPAVFDTDTFTSQTQHSPSKDLFPVSGIQGVDAGSGSGSRLQPAHERDISWKVPPQTPMGFSSPVWTASAQDPWELRPVEISVDKPEPRKHSNILSPEQLLLRQGERLLTPQRHRSGLLDELLHNAALTPGTDTKAGIYGGGSTSTTSSSSTVPEQVWLPRELLPSDSRREPGVNKRSQELNRMRSRSVSRRSTPSSSSVEVSLSRMRSRSAHRERDRHSWVQQKQGVNGEEEGNDSETLVGETDSQYGTWETGLRTDDSLTPATPSSESNLSPSPRKPTPPHTPGDRASHFQTDTVDSLLSPPSSESQTHSFPEAPTTLLDTSVLRSRAQLGKKRAPRTRPTRSARQTAAQAEQEGGNQEDWLYTDSTDAKVESKEEDSDSEDQPRAADTAHTAAAASQPQRVALFPGMDPSVLKAQLKKRGESDSQTDGATPSPLQLSRSPKSPFLPRAARVLPPPGGKENGEENSPQWLKELKSKKRLSQYESES